MGGKTGLDSLPPTPTTKHTEQSDKEAAEFDLNYVYNWYIITFR